jgi:hypothetical protein
MRLLRQGREEAGGWALTWEQHEYVQARPACDQAGTQWVVWVLLRDELYPPKSIRQSPDPLSSPSKCDEFGDRVFPVVINLT